MSVGYSLGLIYIKTSKFNRESVHVAHINNLFCIVIMYQNSFYQRNKKVYKNCSQSNAVNKLYVLLPNR